MKIYFCSFVKSLFILIICIILTSIKEFKLKNSTQKKF